MLIITVQPGQWIRMGALAVRVQHELRADGRERKRLKVDVLSPERERVDWARLEDDEVRALYGVTFPA
jgi:hypothetical protein